MAIKWIFPNQKEATVDFQSCRVWCQAKQPPCGAGKPFPDMVEDRQVPTSPWLGPRWQT